MITWEMERLAMLQKRKEELLRDDKIDSLSKYLQREMIERGNKLDPYEAMLHARRMSKKVHIEQNKIGLFKRELPEQTETD